MYPLYFTYEERWFDQRPQAYQEALEAFSGVEWCLTRADLAKESYRTLMRQATAEGLSLVFHLPHHLVDEGLSVKLLCSDVGRKPNSGILPAYVAYYAAIVDAIRTLGPMATPIRVVHHPMTSSLLDTEALLNALYQQFFNQGLLPVLEPTLDSPNMVAVSTLAQHWEQQTGHRLLCLDIRYLTELGWSFDEVFELLIPYCSYGHFHNPEDPHCALEQLTPAHVAWLTELAAHGAPINLELLLPAYEARTDALQQTLGLIAAHLV